MVISKKKVFTVLFCAFLMTASAFGSALDPEVIQVLRNILQKMAPEELTQIEKQGLSSGWQRVTSNALAEALKNGIPRAEIYDAVLAQLKSPDELSKFMKTHPDLISDLKPGLKESIERLILEGRGEVQASAAVPVTQGLFGRNRLQALVAPTDEELAVLKGETEAPREEIAALASPFQEALPQFLDRAVRQGAAFTENIIPEAEKEILFETVFPKFKVSKELFKYHPEELMALLIEHGEFTLATSTVTEQGTQVVLKSVQAGGIKMTFFSGSLKGYQFTTIDLFYSLQEQGVGGVVPYQNHLIYLNDNIGRKVILRDGESIFQEIFY
ncbi:MAG: hypothetical protein HYY61_04340 [Deltaproteobacteria bacterium]|nr:hypothetical protein [Deltaproteobacteria bacterium]